MHAETLLTIDIDDVGRADSDIYCEFCGDERVEPHVYDVKEDALGGQETYTLICCRECLLQYVKRQHPWAYFQVGVK